MSLDHHYHSKLRRVMVYNHRVLPRDKMRCVADMAWDLGIRVHLSYGKPDHNFVPGTPTSELYVDVDDVSDFPAWGVVLHDLAHFILSTEKHRRTVEYGLGSLDTALTVDSEMDVDHQEYMEQLTTVFSGAMACYFGISGFWTLAKPRFTSKHAHTVNVLVDILHDLGYMADGRPILNASPWNDEWIGRTVTRLCDYPGCRRPIEFHLHRDEDLLRFEKAAMRDHRPHRTSEDGTYFCIWH